MKPHSSYARYAATFAIAHESPLRQNTASLRRGASRCSASSLLRLVNESAVTMQPAARPFTLMPYGPRAPAKVVVGRLTAAFVRDAVDHRLVFPRIAIVHNHRGVLIGHAPGHRLADAMSGCGRDRDLVRWPHVRLS